MLGRGVARAIAAGREPLLDPDVIAIAAAADLFIVNLECCISERGTPWPAVGKPFFFRAPPRAAELLAAWGVDAVTLANNHALDYGIEALLDTFAHLREAGIRWAGAGENVEKARAPVVLEGLPIVAFADHADGFAAGPDRPGIAYADIRGDRVRDSRTGLAAGSAPAAATSRARSSSSSASASSSCPSCLARDPFSAASVTPAPSFLGWQYLAACALAFGQGLPVARRGDLPAGTDQQARPARARSHRVPHRTRRL